ncbi:hypothetical protein ACH5A3_02460 [Streptomyces echinatus]|uniref:hypothetical protein n=1 Tax=Streptomyces echinatus TaxID=67293 RepID=UPI00378EFF28
MRAARPVLAAAVVGVAVALGAGDAPATRPAASAQAVPPALPRIAEPYLQQRAAMLTTSPPALEESLALLQITPELAGRARADLTALRAKGGRYAADGGEYTGARAEAEITGADVGPDTATLRVTEYTRLSRPGVPWPEELALPHTMTFTRGTDGNWLLARDTVDPGEGLPATTMVTDPVAG